MAKRKMQLITSDPQAFRRAMEREANDIMPTYVKETIAQIVYKVFYGVMLSTPVLTGRARVNWTLTTTSPSTKVIDGDQLINEPGHWFSVTGQSFSSTERDAVNAVMESIRKGPMSRRIYLSNNLQYISILEDGIGSSKAPFGMVEITLDWVLQPAQQRVIHRAAIAAT